MRFFSFILSLSLIVSETAYSDGLTAFDDSSVKSSDSIIYARVIEAQELSFDIEGQVEMCGINYKARLLDVFKGRKGGAVMTFSSVFPLVVGEEYLLFSGRKPLPSGLIVELAGELKSKMTTCEEELQAPHLNSTDYFLVKSYPYNLEGKWVEVGGKNLFSNKKKKQSCFYQEGSCDFVAWREVVDKIKRPHIKGSELPEK